MQKIRVGCNNIKAYDNTAIFQDFSNRVYVFSILAFIFSFFMLPIHSINVSLAILLIWDKVYS